MMKDCFVVTDIHGRYELLEGLLHKVGLVNRQGKRIKSNIEIVCLGDVINAKRGHSRLRDYDCLDYVSNVCDVILWGNHDRGAVDRYHGGRCFKEPSEETTALLNGLDKFNLIRFSHYYGNTLLTHAGLGNVVNDYEKKYFKSAKLASQFINSLNGNNSIIDNIGFERGGNHFDGGILWRDKSENIFDGFNQIFGHSKTNKIKKVPYTKFDHYCIDLRAKNKLAGMFISNKKKIVFTDKSSLVRN